MKKRAVSLSLCAALLLSGCSAMLERSYSSTTPHVDRPTTAEDPSVLRVENYRELVSAVLYLVSQQEEEGVIQLHNYAGDEETDLTAACLEVATEDPLGAYCVDYIKHELSRVVSYYQAALAIRYRRTEEQVRSIVNVTGSGAIRTELQEALAGFKDQVVLRVAYFAEDEQSIRRLIRQAYYDAPDSALGMPQAETALYPDSGRERILEITLTYPETPEALRKKNRELVERLDEALSVPPELKGEEAARHLLESLFDPEQWGSTYAPEGGSTAYAALLEGAADDQGLALAYALLCRWAGVPCEVTEGTREGESCFWNTLAFPGGRKLYVLPDCYGETAAVLFDGEALVDLGYHWEGAPEAEPSQPPEESGQPAD